MVDNGLQTGVQDKMLERKKREEYRQYIANSNLEKLEGCIKETGVYPDYYSVQDGYRDYIKSYNFSGLEKLMRISGIQPSQEVVRKGYVQYIRGNYLPQLEKLDKTVKIAAEGIDEDVQEAYRDYINSYNFSSLDQLMKITKIRPKNELIQNGYREYIKHFYFNYMEKLMSLTQIMPSHDVIRGGYSLYIVNGYVNYLQTLKKITGLVPKGIGKDVQSKYMEYIMAVDFANLEKLMDVTKISPSYRMVQEGFNHYFKNHYFSYVEKLENATKILPSQRVLRKAFISYLDEGYLNYVETLKKIPGTSKISGISEAVQEAYRSYIRSDLTSFLKLIEITGIEPSNKVLEEGYEYHLSNGYRSNLERLVKATGFNPFSLPEEKTALLNDMNLFVNYFKDLKDQNKKSIILEIFRKKTAGSPIASKGVEEWLSQNYPEIVKQTILKNL